MLENNHELSNAPNDTRDELADLDCQRPTSIATGILQAIIDIEEGFRAAVQGELRSLQFAQRTAGWLITALQHHGSTIIDSLRIEPCDQLLTHSLRVGALMILLAQHLQLNDTAVFSLGIAGLYHDIGKLFINQKILAKAGPLTAAELALVKQHPRKGFDLLQRLPGMPTIALDVCLHHHEKVDGSGYPHGASTGSISQASRIAAICDVYDALTMARSYKRAWSKEETLAFMASSPGHFDQAMLAAFNRALVANG